MSNVRRLRAACCESPRILRSERALKEALPKSRSIGAAAKRSFNSASSFLEALNQKSLSASRKPGLSRARGAFVALHLGNSYSLAMQAKEAFHTETPNPSIERTRSGSAGLAFISFWAKPAPPPRAAHVKR